MQIAPQQREAAGGLCRQLCCAKRLIEMVLPDAGHPQRTIQHFVSAAFEMGKR